MNEMSLTNSVEHESTEHNRTRTSVSFAINTAFTKGRAAMIYAGNQINGKQDTGRRKRHAFTLLSVTSKSGETQKTKQVRPCSIHCQE